MPESVLPEGESDDRIAPAEKFEAPAAAVKPLPGPGRRPWEMRDHPDFRLLESFMRGELSGAACRTIVRHLMAGCPQCVQITRRFWGLGDS